MLANFLTHYGVPPGVPVSGPYSGSLSNGGERVSLSRPGNPESYTTPSTNLTPDGEWVIFRWFFASGSMKSLDGPYLFEVPPGADAELDVTDWGIAGEVFDVYDNGIKIGTTSALTSSAEVIASPDLAFTNPSWSSGTFPISAGSHSIEIEVVQTPPGWQSGGGFLRVWLRLPVPYIV